MHLTATGPFTVSSTPSPPLHDQDGVSLGRIRFDKRFSGELEGTSFVEMTYVRTPDPSLATYVALERIEGTVAGRSGSFVVHHLGIRSGASETLEIRIVPGSGTGDLAGITGHMTIAVDDGQHTYTLEAQLPVP